MDGWLGGRIAWRASSALCCAHLRWQRAVRAPHVHQLAVTVRWQRVSAIWPLHPQLINNLFIYSFTSRRRSREQSKLTNLLMSTTTAWNSSSWQDIFIFFCNVFYFCFCCAEGMMHRLQSVNCAPERTLTNYCQRALL